MTFRKELLLIIMFVAAVLGLGFFYFKNVEVVKAPNEKINAVAVEDKKITDNTDPFKIDITYPQISGLDDFNKKVKDIIDKEINDFKTNSLENDAAVKQVDPVGYAKYPREYELDISYDKGVVDENTVSVIINIYNFEGGAHGASYSKAVNYSPKTKIEIKLANLFPDQPDYLKTISDFAIKDLTKKIDPQMADNSWINTGAGPKEENYSVFLINKNNITFYIQQYQVAAGAAGSFKVIFPK